MKPRFYLLSLKVILLSLLTGCFPFSVMDAGLLILSLPAGAGTGKVDLEGYTIGTVSSDEFPELFQNAIPASEGEVYLFGRAQWTGLKNIKQPGTSYLQTVAAITNADILYLWWYEEDEHYEILMRLPYAGIQSVTLEKFGLGATIKLCHEVEELLIGGQQYSIDQLTRLDFSSPNGFFIDREKTEKAFELLDDKIKPKEGLNHTPNPCEGDPESTIENQGFGEDDLSMQTWSSDNSCQYQKTGCNSNHPNSWVRFATLNSGHWARFSTNSTRRLSACPSAVALEDTGLA